MTEEKIFAINSSFGKHSIPITSISYEPDSTTAPCMIMCHGLGSNRNGYLDFYKRLSDSLFDNNIQSVRFDFRAHGDSQVDWTEFTVASQIQDLIDVCFWCKATYPNSEIRLFGTSFGAFPCVYLASLFPSIKQLYLLAPVIDYYKTFIQPSTPWGVETFSNILDRSLINKENIKIADKLFLNQDIVIELSTIDIESIISSIDVNITLMHGDNDGMVPYNVSKELAGKYSKIKFHSFKNMEHGFTNKNDDDGTHSATKENFKKIVELLSRTL